MGGRSSKTRPAQSPFPGQSQDTVVQTFDMGAVDELQSGAAGGLCSNNTSSNILRDKDADDNSKQHGGGAASPLATKGSMVQGIWEGRVDNNLAPLSALYGKHFTAPDLQVSSSEDEDEQPHGKKRKKKLARKRKKSAPETKSTTAPPVLKPVKPPPHSPNQHTTIEPLVILEPESATQGSSDAVGDSGGNMNNSPASKLQESPVSKADSPPRFFAISKTRLSFNRPPTGAKEKEMPVREKEPSSGSPDKAATASSVSKVRAGVHCEDSCEESALRLTH